ncbi:hypothetical protein Leryth_006791 [Lithospermum erythrorhizon]|nr:hypothetical protein Leryth_006791 [Lithospermum erythrorhizon]
MHFYMRASFVSISMPRTFILYRFQQQLNQVVIFQDSYPLHCAYGRVDQYKSSNCIIYHRGWGCAASSLPSKEIWKHLSAEASTKKLEVEMLKLPLKKAVTCSLTTQKLEVWVPLYLNASATGTLNSIH